MSKTAFHPEPRFFQDFLDCQDSLTNPGNHENHVNHGSDIPSIHFDTVSLGIDNVVEATILTTAWVGTLIRLRT